MGGAGRHSVHQGLTRRNNGWAGVGRGDGIPEAVLQVGQDSRTEVPQDREVNGLLPGERVQVATRHPALNPDGVARGRWVSDIRGII